MPDIPGIWESNEGNLRAMEGAICTIADGVQAILDAPDQPVSPDILAKLPEWMDTIVTSDWMHARELPENIAQSLFYIYAGQLPREGVEYFLHYLDLPTREDLLHDQVAMMFIGVIGSHFELHGREYRSRTFSWEEWRDVALRVANREIARKYTMGARVAVAGAILSIIFALSQNTPEMATRLREFYRELQKSLRTHASLEEQEDVQYLLMPLETSLEFISLCWASEESDYSSFHPRIS